MNKAAIANLLMRANAFAPFRFLNRGKLPVLMYHRFSEGEEFGKTSRRTFESQLRYLTRHYKVISLSEAVSRVNDRAGMPERSAVITIDDGYRDFYEIAYPILKSFNVTATIYLVTGFVDGTHWIWTDKARYILGRTPDDGLKFSVGTDVFDKILTGSESRMVAAGSLNSSMKKVRDEEKENYLMELARAARVSVPEIPPDEYAPMKWAHAREMASDGIEIGSHTHSHPILTNVSADRLRSEVTHSKAVIEEQLEAECAHFCYPNGNAAARERDAVEAAGYRSAVTTEIKLCENGTDPFLVPRIDAEPEMHRFVQATSGFDRVKG